MERNVTEKMAMACCVCSSPDSEVLFHARDLLYGLEGEFTYVRCRSCGLVYMNPQLAQTDIARYYPEHYGPHAAKSKPKRLTRRMMRKELGRRPFVKEMCRRLCPDARLLDVGCGSGAFLHLVKSACGCEVRGVDASENAAQTARDAHGIHVFAGTLADARLPEGYFDVATAWWVLEHVPDPAQTLGQMNRVLKRGACCIIGIPNFSSFNASVFREYWYHLDCPRHLFIYTPETIKRLLEQNGFRVDRIAFDRNVRGLTGSLRYRFGDPNVPLKHRTKPWGFGVLKRLLVPWALLMGLARRSDLIVVRAYKES